MTRGDLIEWGIVLSTWAACFMLGWLGFMLIAILCIAGVVTARSGSGA